jgi:hypothetical protein
MPASPTLRRGFLLNLFVGAFLACAITPSSQGTVRMNARRAVDASNLRQIMQASLIYASDHHDQFPAATDVHDYARILAEDAGLDVADMWISHIDPAYDDEPLSTVLTSAQRSPRELTPSFKKLKPSVAVVLGQFHNGMPSTTPIAWTRGLQPDGTWASHSPYGTMGGYIAFLAGNVTFYKNLNEGGGEFTRFDGKGSTANILETLPPGCRIGEYLPSAAEQKAWSDVTREFKNQELRARYAPLVGLAVLWLPFIGISIHRFRNGMPGAVTVLLWPVLFMFLLAIIVPVC